MATQRQRKAVQKVVERQGKSVSGAMRDAGYSPKTAKNPKNLTDSKGFEELCVEFGLTDEFLLEALVDDIKGKQHDRKPELELGFKIRGRLKDQKPPGADPDNPLFILPMGKQGDVSKDGQ